MTLEFWIALIVIGVAAFFGGRASASRRREIEQLQAELKSTREQSAAELAEALDKAQAVEEGVTSHFEQSAVLFGKLAQDYRAFLEHFSDSAQRLGLSEGRARELLEQVDHPLLRHDADESEAAVYSASDSDTDTVSATAQDAQSETQAEPSGAPEVEPEAVPTLDDQVAAARGLDPISAKVAELDLEPDKPAEPSKQAS